MPAGIPASILPERKDWAIISLLEENFSLFSSLFYFLYAERKETIKSP
jgi:hypothetical protein